MNELETAYQQGEVSLEEVDAQVSILMAELRQERGATVKFLIDHVSQAWSTQRELMIGLGLISVLTYVWAVIN